MKITIAYHALVLSCIAFITTQAMEKTTPQSNTTSVEMIKSIISGAGAGMAEVCLLGQICSYLINQRIPRPGIPAKKFSLNSKLWTLPEIISLYPKHIYLGMGINVYSMAPITAVQNLFADYGRKKLRERQYTELSDTQQLIPPVTAGAIAALLATPAEFLPNYMQRVATDEQRTLTLKKALLEIYTRYGIWYTWRGLVPTMVRDAGFTAGYKTMPKLLQKPIDSHIDNKPLARMATLIGAGILTSFVTQPAHVIARYIQNNPTIRSSLQAGIDIAKHNGIAGFWKGGIPRGLRVTVAIPTLSTVEKIISDKLH